MAVVTMERTCLSASDSRAKTRARGKQGRYDFEGWIFSGGAYEHKRTVFDVGEDDILLRLVEAMYFVNGIVSLTARSCPGAPWLPLRCAAGLRRPTPTPLTCSKWLFVTFGD